MRYGMAYESELLYVSLLVCLVELLSPRAVACSCAARVMVVGMTAFSTAELAGIHTNAFTLHGRMARRCTDFRLDDVVATDGFTTHQLQAHLDGEEWLTVQAVEFIPGTLIPEQVTLVVPDTYKVSFSADGS